MLLDARLFCCLLVLSLCGCGYRLGPTLGVPAGARSVQVNFFQNETFEPRLSEAIATSLRRTLQQDGTFRLETRGRGDVIVDGVIVGYDRTPLSFDPRDVLRPRDFSVMLTARVTAVERISGRVLFEQEVPGRSSLRVGPDLAAAERQALPLLADDLARNITSLLVDGTW